MFVWLSGCPSRKYRANNNLFLMFLIATLLSGCGGGIRTIKPEYMGGLNARLFDEGEHYITINAFYDDRDSSEKIGAGYNAYGGNIETWITENDPLLVIENAVVAQLEKSGFTVVRIKGWNYDPNSVPNKVETGLIIGGKLKTYWVESRPGFWTVTINSKVVFDLFITDTKGKKNLYTGQFTGKSQNDEGYRTEGDMQNAISFALTVAVNKVFQDETVREILLKQ